MDKEINSKQIEPNKDTQLSNNTLNNSHSNLIITSKDKNKKQLIIDSIIEAITTCSLETQSLSTKFIASILSKDYIEFISICAFGFPEEMKILQTLAWKINLNLLPFDKDNWSETLNKKRIEYSSIKQIMITKISKEKEKYDLVKNDKVALRKFKTNRHLTLMEDIERDLDRTQMKFPSLFQPTDDNVKYTEEEVKQTKLDRKEFLLYDIKDQYQTGKNETHADVIARLLFYYSNYYPDVYYNQGMNEIICPIYYCYSYDRLYLNKEDIDIEADTFWSFFELMEQLKHVFLRDEDNNDNGIASKASHLNQMLGIVDKELSDYLASIDVQFSFFSYRWFILLFAQDFGLDDVMKLWDLFFVRKIKFYYVYYFAIALIEMKREKLIGNCMIEILTELQNFSDINVNEAIELTLKLQNEHSLTIDPIIL